MHSSKKTKRKSVNVRITEAEHAALARAAELALTDVSKYVRKLIVNSLYRRGVITR